MYLRRNATHHEPGTKTLPRVVAATAAHTVHVKLCFASVSRGVFLPHQGLNISVTGIPKTIDNDLDIIDRSFGFLTAVEVTQSTPNQTKR